MSGDSLPSLLKFVDLPSVFAVSVLEKFLPVLPSYVLFPTIGMAATSTEDVVARCLVATFGSVAGAAAWYLFGSAVGPSRTLALVRRYGSWIFLSPKLYEELAGSYRRRAFVVTLLGQLVPTVRIYQALPAGALRLPMLPFLLATAVGAFCWISLLTSAGHLLRQSGWDASQIGLVMVLLILATELLAVVIALGRRN